MKFRLNSELVIVYEALAAFLTIIVENLVEKLGRSGVKLRI